LFLSPFWGEKWNARWSRACLLPANYFFANLREPLAAALALPSRFAEGLADAGVDSEEAAIDEEEEDEEDEDEAGASFICLFGLPNSHWLTWLANRKEHMDSKYDSSVGLKLTNYEGVRGSGGKGRWKMRKVCRVSNVLENNIP